MSYIAIKGIPATILATAQVTLECADCHFAWSTTANRVAGIRECPTCGCEEVRPCKWSESDLASAQPATPPAPERIDLAEWSAAGASIERRAIAAIFGDLQKIAAALAPAKAAPPLDPERELAKVVGPTSAREAFEAMPKSRAVQTIAAYIARYDTSPKDPAATLACIRDIRATVGAEAMEDARRRLAEG